MKITYTGPTKRDLSFPCLMQGDESGVIVLFYSEGRGTVLDPGRNKKFALGEHTSTWAMDCFAFLEGPITLEN